MIRYAMATSVAAIDTLQLKERENGLVEGEVLVGSNFTPVNVLVDTSRTDSALTLKYAFGQSEQRSNYSAEESPSAEIFHENGAKTAGNAIFGKSVLSGFEVLDNVCIGRKKCDRMPFLGIEDIESEKSFEPQGFLGFGPNKSLFDPFVAIHADDDG